MLPTNQLIQPAPIIDVNRTLLQIPAFAISAPAWAGYSVLVGEFPISNGTRALALATPIDALHSSFVLAVRWVNTSGVAQRFVLWADPNAVLFYDIYSGQTIGTNATLEVWSNSISAGVCTLPVSITLPTSWLNYPLTYLYGCLADAALVQSLVLVAPVTLPPGAYCNPFCVCLTTF